MEQEHQPSYVAYEYKEIEAKGERAALLMDCYQSLGWEAEKETASGKIMLRRSRKIINKAELTRLQRNLEACVAEIDGGLAVYPAGGSGLYAVGAGSDFISTDGR